MAESLPPLSPVVRLTLFFLLWPLIVLPILFGVSNNTPTELKEISKSEAKGQSTFSSPVNSVQKHSEFSHCQSQLRRLIPGLLFFSSLALLSIGIHLFAYASMVYFLEIKHKKRWCKSRVCLCLSHRDGTWRKDGPPLLKMLGMACSHTKIVWCSYHRAAALSPHASHRKKGMWVQVDALTPRPGLSVLAMVPLTFMTPINHWALGTCFCHLPNADYTISLTASRI